MLLYHGNYAITTLQPYGCSVVILSVLIDNNNIRINMKNGIFDRLEATQGSLSVEDHIDEMALMNTYSNYENTINDALSAISFGNESLERIHTDLVSVDLKVKDNILTKHDIVLSFEELNTISDKAFGEVIFSDSVILATEDGDITISIEEVDALKAAKRSLTDRLKKAITNAWGRLKDTFADLESTALLLASFKTRRMEELLNSIKKGDLKPKSDSVVNSSINKELGVYFELNNGSSFDVKSFIKHINIPYDMIIKHSLFESAFEYAKDELVVGRDAEKTLPTHKESIKLLSGFKSPEIRSWLEASTKFGMLVNILGNKFSIVSVSQSPEHGADARRDYFDVNKSNYNSQKLPTFTSKDGIELLTGGIAMAPKGRQLGKIGKEAYIKRFTDSITSNIMTYIWGSLFGIFAIKRTCDVFVT